MIYYFGSLKLVLIIFTMYIYIYIYDATYIFSFYKYNSTSYNLKYIKFIIAIEKIKNKFLTFFAHVTFLSILYVKYFYNFNIYN